MLLRMWIDALMEWSKFLGYSWYRTMRTVLMQIFTLVLVFLVILWIAVFCYGTFYFFYMPQVAHERDVHLQFRTDCEDFQTKQQMCSFPSANFSLVKPHQAQFLLHGQSYVVSIEFIMPESPVNEHHGMFMTYLQFYSHHGEPLKSSIRSVSAVTMLHYKSSLLKAVETLFQLPLLLLGYTEERQAITTELFQDYQEDYFKPAQGVYMEVQSRNIEIYSAKMRIHARFTGLRYLLFHWPLLSCFCGVSVNMFFLCIVAMLSWYQFTFRDEQAAAGKPDSASPLRPAHGEKHKMVRAMKEREARKQQGLAASSSSPNLHKRAASVDLPPITVETVLIAEDTRERSMSTDTEIRQRKPIDGM